MARWCGWVKRVGFPGIRVAFGCSGNACVARWTLRLRVRMAETARTRNGRWGTDGMV